MRTSDLLRMCLQNLTRRKSRTILTVMGVLIGCCAIVIMVSLGFGTQEAQDQMLAQMGDLTVIQVYNYGGTENKITDETIGSYRAIGHVIGVTPKLELGTYYYPEVKTGPADRYQSRWATVMGIDMESADTMGYELLEGTMPAESDEVLVGQYFAYNFYDSFRPDGYNYVDRWSGGWDENGNPINVPDPYFDPVGCRVTLSTTLNNGVVVEQEYKVVGMLKEDYNRGYETSSGLVLDVGSARSYIEKCALKEGTKKKEVSYTEVYVKVDEINNVADAQAEVEKIGFDCYSMESIRKPLQEEARQKQLMLGGLGAISLLVAAIGIANTMIMSISERTKEIGIMKSLGCYVHDIRAMFLMEAGFIGLIGGILATIVSFVAMIVINIISFGMGFNPEALKLCFTGSETMARTSVIPWWLMVFGLLFSIIIGLVSGYMPANKAVKVSALEAIRSSE